MKQMIKKTASGEMDGNGHSAAEKIRKEEKKSSHKNRGNKDSGKDNAKQQTDERAKRMEWKDCEISYDPSTHMYRISNTGQSRILLLKR